MYNIKIQSAVDVITNSSTSIYTIAGDWTLETIRNIINTTLEIGGSELKADDLFEFKLNIPDFDDYNDFRDRCIEYVLDNNIPTEDEYRTVEILEQLCKEEQNQIEKKHQSFNIYDKYQKKIEEVIGHYITDRIKSLVALSMTSGYYSRGYTITPKQNIEKHKKLADLLSNLQNLFNIEASYD